MRVDIRIQISVGLTFVILVALCPYAQLCGGHHRLSVDDGQARANAWGMQNHPGFMWFGRSRWSVLRFVEGHHW